MQWREKTGAVERPSTLFVRRSDSLRGDRQCPRLPSVIHASTCLMTWPCTSVRQRAVAQLETMPSCFTPPLPDSKIIRQTSGVNKLIERNAAADIGILLEGFANGDVTAWLITLIQRPERALKHGGSTCRIQQCLFF